MQNNITTTVYYYLYFIIYLSSVKEFKSSNVKIDTLIKFIIAIGLLRVSNIEVKYNDIFNIICHSYRDFKSDTKSLHNSADAL